MQTSHPLWAEKYAARFAALRALEETARAEAFVDLPRTVAGQSLRVMTAADLHLLDGSGNAFVCGSLPDAGHVVAFIWQLHAERPAGGWRLTWWRWRLLLALSQTDAARAVEDIRNYLDFVFFDAPSGSGSEKESRPFGGNFLAPLLGDLSAEFGAFDPFTGRPWGRVPIPQLFQFQKVAARRANPRDFVDRNPSDKLLSDFLAELNEKR